MKQTYSERNIQNIRMKSADIKYLDGKITVQEQEPSTIVELTALIGEEGIVDETVSNLRYRGKYPRVYSAVSADLVKTHAFPKLVVKTKTLADGKSIRHIHESENDHIRAFLGGRKAVPAVLNPDGTEKTPAVAETVPAPDAEATLQALFTTHGNAEPLYTESERQGGTGKISKDAMDSANAFFAKGEETVSKVVAKIESLVSGYKIDVDADGQPTPEGVARGIMRLNKQIEQNAKKQAAAALVE